MRNKNFLNITILTAASLFLSSYTYAADNQATGAQPTNTRANIITNEVTSTLPESADNQPTATEDKIITDSIKAQIAKSKTLNGLDVTITTQKGVVTLNGHVDSDSQASNLVEIAQSIIGVQDVDSNLTVADSKQPMTDMLITAKIKGLFLREKVFGDKDIAAINISVETKNGVVYLSGTVNNPQQIKNAIKLIQTVKGVKRVEYNVNKVTTAHKS